MEPWLLVLFAQEEEHVDAQFEVEATRLLCIPNREGTYSETLKTEFNSPAVIREGQGEIDKHRFSKRFAHPTLPPPASLHQGRTYFA